MITPMTIATPYRPAYVARDAHSFSSLVVCGEGFPIVEMVDGRFTISLSPEDNFLSLSSIKLKILYQIKQTPTGIGQAIINVRIAALLPCPALCCKLTIPG